MKLRRVFLLFGRPRIPSSMELEYIDLETTGITGSGTWRKTVKFTSTTKRFLGLVMNN
jgi:phage antirepressor YoqD-like protein